MTKNTWFLLLSLFLVLAFVTRCHDLPEDCEPSPIQGCP
jgi:hypothetical protein